MRTPETIYRQFIEFEEKAAAVYVKLAARFATENPELCAFWLDMALQEKEHAGLLQFCIAQRLFTPDLPEDEQIHLIGRLFQRLDQLAEEPALDLEAAFEIAAEMERSELNELFGVLTTSVHASLYLLRRKITICDRDHDSELLEAGRRFGLSAKPLGKLEHPRTADRKSTKSNRP